VAALTSNLFEADLKPGICSSHLLRLVNPCCNACFTIFFLTISIDMPSSKNRSNYTFRFGLRRLATMPTAKSGLKKVLLLPEMLSVVV
jgi:hypothetical protein